VLTCTDGSKAGRGDTPVLAWRRELRLARRKAVAPSSRWLPPSRLEGFELVGPSLIRHGEIDATTFEEVCAVVSPVCRIRLPDAEANRALCASDMGDVRAEALECDPNLARGLVVPDPGNGSTECNRLARRSWQPSPDERLCRPTLEEPKVPVGNARTAVLHDAR
jgi:hypothetical protein